VAGAQQQQLQQCESSSAGSSRIGGSSVSGSSVNGSGGTSSSTSGRGGASNSSRDGCGCSDDEPKLLSAVKAVADAVRADSSIEFSVLQDMSDGDLYALAALVATLLLRFRLDEEGVLLAAERDITAAAASAGLSPLAGASAAQLPITTASSSSSNSRAGDGTQHQQAPAAAAVSGPPASGAPPAAAAGGSSGGGIAVSEAAGDEVKEVRSIYACFCLCVSRCNTLCDWSLEREA
jgi:hypothetical protein